MQVQHKNILELIRKYLPDFEAFGRVAFETQPFETAGGTQKREIAWLNEDQTTLLFTFLKNTEIARMFSQITSEAALKLGFDALENKSIKSKTTQTE